MSIKEAPDLKPSFDVPNAVPPAGMRRASGDSQRYARATRRHGVEVRILGPAGGVDVPHVGASRREDSGDHLRADLPDPMQSNSRVLSPRSTGAREMLNSSSSPALRYSSAKSSPVATGRPRAHTRKGS